MKTVHMKLIKKFVATGEAWEIYELTLPCDTHQVMFEIPHDRTLFL